MKAPAPIQIEPLLDPNQPETTNRFPYYLLEEMHSPPISSPNAVRWRAYHGPRTLRQGGLPDQRVAYGFIEYEERLSWADLKKYNMLPFDYAESLLFDLWQALGEDKAKLADFFERFFKVIEDDPDLSRIESALGLVYWGRTPEQIKESIEAIEE
jgi:hypothetical protein